jgi:hypothetical protein
MEASGKKGFRSQTGQISIHLGKLRVCRSKEEVKATGWMDFGFEILDFGLA